MSVQGKLETILGDPKIWPLERNVKGLLNRLSDEEKIKLLKAKDVASFKAIGEYFGLGGNAISRLIKQIRAEYKERVKEESLKPKPEPEPKLEPEPKPEPKPEPELKPEPKPEPEKVIYIKEENPVKEVISKSKVKEKKPEPKEEEKPEPKEEEKPKKEKKTDWLLWAVGFVGGFIILVILYHWFKGGGFGRRPPETPPPPQEPSDEEILKQWEKDFELGGTL